MKTRWSVLSLLPKIIASWILAYGLEVKAQPAGYPIYPNQSFSWLVVGTGTETWTTQTQGAQQVSAASSFQTPTPVEVGFTAPESGTATVGYSISETIIYDGSIAFGWVQILNSSMTVIKEVTFDENNPGLNNGNTTFPVAANDTYYLKVYVANATVSYPALVTVTDTATRTASDTQGNNVNASQGQIDVGGFYAEPQPLDRGTISGVSYTMSANNPNVVVVFSDTGTASTANPNAHIYAQTIAPPSFTRSPQSASIFSGGSTNFSITATGAAPLSYQWYFNASPIPGANSTSISIADASTTNNGNYSVVATNPVGAVLSTPAALTVVPLMPPLAVTSLQPNPSGVTIDFNRPINSSVLFMYGSTNPADFSLVGQTSGSVGGSLIIGSAGTNITFVKTNTLLSPDTYTVTLVSGTNGFEDTDNNLLDGNGDGIPGDNYVRQFTVAASTNYVLSLPSFARAPGQTVNVPAESPGIPVTLNEGSNVRSILFNVQYDTNLLNVTGVLRGSLPPGWSLSSEINQPGNIEIEIVAGGVASLLPGTSTLVTFQAQVPWCAPYGAVGILNVSSAEINLHAIGVTGGSAVQLAALPGDINGNGYYDANDIALLLQYEIGVNTNGFPAYPLIHPAVIGDILDNGYVSSSDFAVLADTVNGVNAPAMPVLPAPLLNVSAGNAQLLFSWPACADDYSLQSSSSLGTQAIWTTATNVPVLAGNQQVITIKAPSQTQFYRLVK